MDKKYFEEKCNSATTTIEKVAAYNTLHNFIFHCEKNQLASAKCIKKYFDASFDLAQQAELFYYELDPQKFVNMIRKYSDIQVQHKLLLYLKSLFRRENYSYFSSVINKHILRIKILIEFREFNLLSGFKIIFYWSSIRFINLVSLLILIFLTISIFLLPAEIEVLSLFQFEKYQYHSNWYLNHALNVLALCTDVDGRVKLIPLSSLALITISFVKLFLVVIFINYIVYEITKRISFND